MKTIQQSKMITLFLSHSLNSVIYINILFGAMCQMLNKMYASEYM